MAVTCTPGNLVELASCFSCLSQRQRDAIKTYLTAIWAGVEPEPGVLLEAAKCFLCLEADQLAAIQTYLLCQGGGGGACANLSGSGSPVGVVTPTFVGQSYEDTAVNPNAIYVSTGTTSADWSLFGQEEFTAGGHMLNGSSQTGVTYLETQLLSGLRVVSNALLTSLSLPNLTTISNGNGALDAIFINGNSELVTLSLPALSDVSIGSTIITSNAKLTAISIPQLVTSKTITIQTNALLTSVSLPLAVGGSLDVAIQILSNVSLTSLTLTSLAGALLLQITGNVALGSISLPALTATGGAFAAAAFTGNTALTSISAPLLVTAADGITANNLANLTTLTLTSYLPTNGKAQNFGGCALTEASVDHVLARCVANAAYVSGTVTLNGGTNAPPSAAGAADKATLIGRGCTVNTN